MSSYGTPVNKTIKKYFRNFLNAIKFESLVQDFELNGKRIRVGRAMFPPPQLINSGPETNFTRTSTAKVSSPFLLRLLFETFYRKFLEKYGMKPSKSSK